MIITHRREKLINAMIYFAKNTQYCGKTKLMKLLYYLDFFHFKETGRTVTGSEYFAWRQGPVPKDVFNELSRKPREDMAAAVAVQKISGFQKIIAKKQFDSRAFTNKEMEILKNCAFIFKNSKSDEIVESTHLKNQPWDKTIIEKGYSAKIDYLLAIDDSNTDISKDEARQRLEERQEMYRLFGAI